MVVPYDPNTAGTQTAPELAVWQPRPRITRQRDKESAVPESLFPTAEFSRKTALSILGRHGLLSSQFRPATDYEQMLVADMAVAQSRIDRAAELQVAAGDCEIGRTARFWDEDQRARALNLKARLPKDPARVSHTLTGFKQGAELAIELWDGLASVLTSADDWDEAQRSMALDLLGVHLELRSPNAPRLPAAGDRDGLASLAAGEIARLTGMITDVLTDRDEDAREEALADLAPADSARIKRLKHAEAIARRDYARAFGELKRVRAEATANPGQAGQTLRPTHVDPLIRRIKNISEPPAVTAEIEAMLTAKRLAAQAAAVAKVPAPCAATQEAPIVATETAPAAASTLTERTVERSDAETPTGRDGDSASVLAISDDPPARLSRRARKIHQKRMQRAARLQERATA